MLIDILKSLVPDMTTCEFSKKRYMRISKEQ